NRRYPRSATRNRHRLRGRRQREVRIENDVDDRMQLDRVRRHTFLPFLIIKEPHPRYRHRNIHRLKFKSRGELCLELSARMRNACGKWTARPNTIRIRNLGYHRTAGTVLE